MTNQRKPKKQLILGEVMPDGDIQEKEDSGPSTKAEVAFHDYYALGPGRSFQGLVDYYKKQRKEGYKPPTSSARTIRRWSRDYDWDRRIEIKDLEIVQQQNALIQKKALEITSSEWMSAEGRLEKLSSLADILWAEIQAEESRWLLDVKQIGGGRNAQRVNLRKFNSQLIEQFRRTLDDISKELGQRKKELSVEDHRTITEHQILEIRDSRWEQVSKMLPQLFEEEGSNDEPVILEVDAKDLEDAELQ